MNELQRVTVERDAALVEVERIKNMDHRQILAESAAKYLLDSGAEYFIGDVFTIEADDGQTKFEVTVTTQKVGAKSPGELCNELQQRLTAADERADELEGLLRELLAGTGSSPGANRKYGRARDVLAGSQKQASPEPYQGIPGTSFQRLNALANQGE